MVRPVEGTILTVASAAAEGAANGSGLVGVVESARSEAADALARTPEMLPVLAQAGVVDAGGAGFLLLLDAFLHVLDGRPLPQPSGVAAPDLSALNGGWAAAGADEGGLVVGEHVGDLRYEVMYLLAAPDDSIEAFKEVWAGVGDSIVVVGGDGLWNCHIHTNDIGAAIEAGVDAGRPQRIRVDRPRRAGRRGTMGTRERGRARGGAEQRGDGAAADDERRGRGLGRRDRSHLPLPRGAPPRRRRADDEPGDRRPGQGR